MDQLSITIITKNEEDHITGCLETVRALGEIIVVDSGSTDQTLDICRKFGAKVFSKDWSGFGPQKNYA
ncbi:MAG: glycosyltransferase, partial [bacterium]|nr:glycosyltransferase [bacterium]